MTAALTVPTVNLRVGAGARFRHTFTAPLGDTGTPLNVTGWAGRGQVRAHPHSPTVLYTWPVGQVICSGTTVTVQIPVAASSLWSWTSAFYQIEVVEPDDDQGVYRVASGALVVDPWYIGPADPGSSGSLYPDVDLYPDVNTYPVGTSGGYGYGGYGDNGYGD